ncbi:MAG: hypothetical protein WBC33_07235 [Conexibacter sp.]
MPHPESLRRILAPLPYRLREEVGGYVDAVASSSDDIYREASVDRTEVPLDAFLTLAGVWRLWSLVESQDWLIDNSLAISSAHGIAAVRFGARSLRRGEGEAVEVRRLRAQLTRLLARHGAEFVVSARGVRDVLIGLAARGVDGR